MLFFITALALSCGDMYSDLVDNARRFLPQTTSQGMSLHLGAADVSNGGSLDAGSTIAGTPRDLVFTIQNTGTTGINLTGAPLVEITGTGASSFSVTALPLASISAGGSTSFTIRFDPSSTGIKTVTVRIQNSTAASPFEFTLTGTCTLVPEPEINILQGASTLSNGDNFDFGPAVVGAYVDVVFTVQNIGTAGLNLTGIPRVTLSGVDAASYSVTASPATPVAASGSTTFTVRFAPLSAGPKDATISIASNDADENPYVIDITGTGREQEINIRQGAGTIANGGSYDFGSTVLGSPYDVIFTIENTGYLNLDLTGAPLVQISGPDASSFSVIADPFTPIVAGGSAAFTVRFDPVTAGLKNAVIIIPNNDSDEDPYVVDISGTGTVPDINLRRGASNIANGGSFDFGDTVINTNNDVVFTIENTGSAPLSLTGSPRVVIGGADASLFSVTVSPSTPVAASGSTTFTLRFRPITLGSKNATVSIASDDPDENPYSFTVTGNGTVQDINVKRGATDIPSGGSFDFGSALPGVPTDIVFTIENFGSAPLNLTGSPRVAIGGADASSFSVTVSPSTPVAASGSTTFTVRFDPVSAGSKTASISIANDDPDENPYSFTITGNCQQPFVTRWVTNNTSIAVTGSTQIKLPLDSGGIYNFIVHWGDGNSDIITSYNQAEATHTYASEGTYTVTIYGQIEGFGFAQTGEDNSKLSDVLQWGPVRLHNNGYQFCFAYSLLSFSAAGAPDLSNVTNMSSMFRDSFQFNGDLSLWDVSNATDMSYMFCYANNFNGNITTWNVQSVTNMSHMFQYDFAFNQDISGWDVSSVSDMSYMFYSAAAFNQNLSSWCVSLIPSEPFLFDDLASAWVLPRPVWSTCP